MKLAKNIGSNALNRLSPMTKNWSGGLSKRYLKCRFVNFLPEDYSALFFSYAFAQNWPPINGQ